MPSTRVCAGQGIREVFSRLHPDGPFPEGVKKLNDLELDFNFFTASSFKGRIKGLIQPGKSYAGWLEAIVNPVILEAGRSRRCQSSP